MFDNYYDLYQLKQKEHEQRIYAIQNRPQVVQKKTMSIHFRMPTIIGKVKELLTHKQYTKDTTCCTT